MSHCNGVDHERLWLISSGIGLYVSDLENRSLDSDFMALMFGKPVPYDTVKKGSEPNVLEIDLTKAWAESDQKAGWSNEVAIEILIR